VLLAATFMYLAWQRYAVHPEKPAAMLAEYGPGGRLAGSFGGRFYALAFDKYRVDEVYQVVFVDFTKTFAGWMSWFDSKVVDGFVNFIAYVVLVIRWIVGKFDSGIVDGLVIGGVAWIISAGGRAGRRFQSGDLQQYLRWMALGAAATTSVYFLILIAHAKGF
jgi:NADH:ubiquinone oxidoreductase subunit 5 (subunit L)/multisubunit Na+/H+ antiporter MnhA subunit